MSEEFSPGVPPPTGIIPLCVPEVRGNEWKYIKECLDTNWVSSVGPFVDRFEQETADFIGARYAVATVNGTAALHIALLVAGVRPEDEVLVSTLTFIAPVNAIRYVGAHPVFIDAESNHWQMDPQLVIDFLNKECTWHNSALYNRKTERRIGAIIPVHILGHPVEMNPIINVAKTYNIPIIEDATESLGATYQEKMVGILGDISCFSFNGNKIITTGGGGMIVTDNESWAAKSRYLSTQSKDDPLEYIHNEIGYNYRLTNIQAAMGCAQMERIREYINIKRDNASAYASALQTIPGITVMQEAEWALSTYWLYTVLIEEATYGIKSRELLKLLNNSGIQVRPLWQPIHQSPAHSGEQTYYGDIAERLNREALSLPSSVGMNSNEQMYVISQLAHHASIS